MIKFLWGRFFSISPVIPSLLSAFSTFLSALLFTFLFSLLPAFLSGFFSSYFFIIGIIFIGIIFGGPLFLLQIFDSLFEVPIEWARGADEFVVNRFIFFVLDGDLSSTCNAEAVFGFNLWRKINIELSGKTKNGFWTYISAKFWRILLLWVEDVNIISVILLTFGFSRHRSKPGDVFNFVESSTLESLFALVISFGSSWG